MQNFPISGLTQLEQAEQAARLTSSTRLHKQLEYFRFLLESLLIALHNSGTPITITTDKNNPLLFAFMASTRSAATAKAAMDLAISGHPFEAMGLTRILGEIAECTQYLVRHPDKIDRFISGSLKTDQVLKDSKSEKPKGSSHPFGHMWGIQSMFAHASSNLLVLGLAIDGPSLSSPILVSDPARVDDAVHGINAALLTQYVVYRMALSDALEPLEELASRDDLLFSIDQIRNVVSEEGMADELVDSIRQFLTSIRHNSKALAPPNNSMEPTRPAAAKRIRDTI